MSDERKASADECIEELVEQGFYPDEARCFAESLLATVRLATSRPAGEITPDEWRAAQATKQ